MIGIIGFGRFGKLAARYLARDFDVLVFNPTDKSAEIKESGALEASLRSVCQQKVIILCVPISILKKVLVEIGPLLKQDRIVVDVCSVKVYPVQWMQGNKQPVAIRRFETPFLGSAYLAPGRLITLRKTDFGSPIHEPPFVLRTRSKHPVTIPVYQPASTIRHLA